MRTFLQECRNFLVDVLFVGTVSMVFFNFLRSRPWSGRGMRKGEGGGSNCNWFCLFIKYVRFSVMFSVFLCFEPALCVESCESYLAEQLEACLRHARWSTEVVRDIFGGAEVYNIIARFLHISMISGGGEDTDWRFPL